MKRNQQQNNDNVFESSDDEAQNPATRAWINDETIVEHVEQKEDAVEQTDYYLNIVAVILFAAASFTIGLVSGFITGMLNDRW